MQDRHFSIAETERGFTKNLVKSSDPSWGEQKFQEFEVIFDTGSGNLIVPGVNCTVSACTQHRRPGSSGKTSSCDPYTPLRGLMMRGARQAMHTTAMAARSPVAEFSGFARIGEVFRPSEVGAPFRPEHRLPVKVGSNEVPNDLVVTFGTGEVRGH